MTSGEDSVMKEALASEDVTVITRGKPKAWPDRAVLAGVLASLAAAIAYLALFPWAGSPDSKLRVALNEFDGYQVHLQRVCRSGQLRTGELSFQQTGIPDAPLLHKRLPLLKMKVSVLAAGADSLVLSVTLPELAGEGIHSLRRSEVIPAGATLRSRGRCDGGTLYWSRLESTLPEERLASAGYGTMR